MKLDKEDCVVLMAHWRNEAAQTPANDPEYETYCTRKARKFQKELERLSGYKEPKP